MKQLVRTQLLANQVIQDSCAGRVYSLGGLGHGGIPAMPQKPFIIINDGGSFAFLGMQDVTRPARTALQVYAYQKRGSYTTINRLLIAIRETLLALPGQSSPSGLYRCTGLTWTGFSREDEDQTYDANMRYVTADIVGTQL